MTTCKVLGAALLAALTSLAFGQKAPTPAAFCDKLKALTEDPAVAAVHWGVSVTTLDGVSLCGVNQSQLFRPASNNKLFTIAAALALLPPDTRFTTRVVADGDLTGGVLTGNLKLVGGGDANFGSTDIPYVPPALQPKPPKPEPATIADIEELADQIVARGVKTITGDVVGDDTYFSWQPYPLGWDIGDLSSSDGAPVSALTIHDSALQIQVAPNPDRTGKAILTTVPDVPYYTLENSVYTNDLGQKDRGCGARLKYQRPPGSLTILVFGDIPPGAQPCKHDTAIQDPAEYAALALKQALERRGVKIAGVAVAKHHDPQELGGVFTDQHDPDPFLQRVFQHDPHPLTWNIQAVAGPPQAILATHVSPTLLEDVTMTAKVSQNLHAELLLRDLGVAYRGNTERDSLHVVHEYLLFAGMTPADFVLYDGSGLSGHDLVAPRALTQLLVFEGKQKWFDSFKAALPIGGVDGTIASRFTPPNSKLQGRVFAKTGTLGESRDLSGYVTAASGATIVFSIMADNHRPDSSADRVAMDKIVELIAASN